MSIHKFKIICTAFLFVFCVTLAEAQRKQSKMVQRYRVNHPKDTTSLLYALKKGKFSGHLRSFSMFTSNYQVLQDYYAQALGGGIAYESATFRKFNFKVSNYYVYEVGSNLTKIDSVTQLKDRYEVTLFDVENPTNRNDLDRLEELNIRYSTKKTKITYGRQIINTPLINPQDSRMRPTLMHGFWFNDSHLPSTVLEGGWLYKSSPRSTIKWFDFGNSVGVYSQGVYPNGSKGDYRNNLDTKGIFVLGSTTNLKKIGLKIQVWDFYSDNIFNTFFAQMDYNLLLEKGKKPVKLILGGQYMRQNAINNGGNIDQNKTYFEKNGQSTAYGGRLGIGNNRAQFTINYSRITDEGRFLFPREWGREPFYTFLTRERTEGCGDVQAYMMNYTEVFKGQNLKMGFGLGYYELPDVKNTALNKYGLPSYVQANVEVRYSIKKGFYKGLDMHWILAYKKNEGNIYGNEKYRLNKVDMLNANWVLNYRF